MLLLRWHSAWQRAAQHVDLNGEIDNMLERIRRERGSGSDFLDFKTGTGGIIEAEFLVQALQMAAGIWEPNWTLAVDRLGDCAQFSGSETENLKSAYNFLRRCESVLRRFENKSLSILPSDPVEQRTFSRRLNFEKIDMFMQQYRAARWSIHEIYDRRIKNRELSSAEQLQDFLQDVKAHQ